MTAARPMTTMQAQVLDFYRSYYAEHGWAPSFSEVTAAIGTTSRSGAFCAVRNLVKLGKLKVIGGKGTNRRYRPVETRTLFTSGDFTLHSGWKSAWIINCATLGDADWETLALMAVEILPPFRCVTGIPRGGLKFAAALQKHTVAEGHHLFADDVFTTGRSLNEEMGPLDIGIVVFSRGIRPINVMALWQALGPRASISDIDFTGGKIPKGS